MQAAFLSSLVGVGTVIARPLIGWLFDRFYATYVAVPLFLAAALGCLLLLWAGPSAAPLTALLIGIGSAPRSTSWGTSARATSARAPSAPSTASSTACS